MSVDGENTVVTEKQSLRTELGGQVVGQVESFITLTKEKDRKMVEDGKKLTGSWDADDQRIRTHEEAGGEYVGLVSQCINPMVGQVNNLLDGEVASRSQSDIWANEVRSLVEELLETKDVSKADYVRTIIQNMLRGQSGLSEDDREWVVKIGSRLNENLMDVDVNVQRYWMAMRHTGNKKADSPEWSSFAKDLEIVTNESVPAANREFALAATADWQETENQLVAVMSVLDSYMGTVG